MGDIIELRPAQHKEGEAVCISCNHSWVAVAPIETTWLECPGCGAYRGIFKYPCIPEDQPVRECGCGNQLFYLTPEGHLCPNCGNYQKY